ILQPDAYASFAGLFTAKEAMVKAGLGVRSFHMIEIAHTPEGKPVFPGYQLSIAHAGPVAVAVAIADDGAGGRAEGINTAGSFQPQGGGQKGGRLVSWLALLLSIVAIILIFTR
ncbi:MAG TPA: hypothetical protein VHD83_13915, partial [Puia sp.]|nr:hypothetical protein [Puia sp.]